MGMDTKYALLDTDFISKAHLARNGDTALADLVLNFDGYEFYCHEKIVEELVRHNVREASQWLNAHIADGKIRLYSDADIITELSPFYGDFAWNGYLSMLRTSCNAFSSDFFPQYYGVLDVASLPSSNDIFLENMKDCDSKIPVHSSLGEKKTYVLIQMMQFLHPGQVCIFCSDDSNARRDLSLINADVKCMSILAAFRKMHTSGIGTDTLRKYYESYTSFLTQSGQTNFHVWMATETPRRMRVPMEQVFEDIINDRFITLANGDLKYRSE